MEKIVIVTFLCLCAVGTLGNPVREPDYRQFLAQQPVQYQEQYLQQVKAQPQYITATVGQGAGPVYDERQRQQPQQYPSQPLPQVPPQRPPQRVLLPTNVDRQIQKVAQQTAGPYYLQQVQAVQQQAQVAEAQAAAQRRAQTAALRAQQQLQAAQGAQPQYLREVPQGYNAKPLARPQPLRPSPPGPLIQQEQEPEEHDTDASYQFGFDVKDDLYTNYQNRKEQRENGKITGSYSVVDSDGFIRTVTYTADPKDGFKAEVVRQPTDIVVKIPTPAPVAKPQQHYIEEVPAPRLQQGQKQNVIYQYQ